MALNETEREYIDLARMVVARHSPSTTPTSGWTPAVWVAIAVFLLTALTAHLSAINKLSEVSRQTEENKTRILALEKSVYYKNP